LTCLDFLKHFLHVLQLLSGADAKCKAGGNTRLFGLNYFRVFGVLCLNNRRTIVMTMNRRRFGAGLMAALMAPSKVNAATNFKPIPTQFLAALADPKANSGTGAESWGLWTLDPGPRGVRLRNYEKLVADGGVAPSQWKFDASSWWLEEHGLIMEQPDSAVMPGKYVVTGDRAVQTVLTIYPKDANGAQRWELADGATLYDVTHLRCRAARYTLRAGSNSCTPATAQQSDFPVPPGDVMPMVGGCDKQDHAVLFVVGVEV
jgi:hypothetical protein